MTLGRDRDRVLWTFRLCEHAGMVLDAKELVTCRSGLLEKTGQKKRDTHYFANRNFHDECCKNGHTSQAMAATLKRQVTRLLVPIRNRPSRNYRNLL